MPAFNAGAHHAWLQASGFCIHPARTALQTAPDIVTTDLLAPGPQAENTAEASAPAP